jgi:hypothetical protein
MTEFEKILQECLLALERGDSNLDECLSRYPKHALQLEPILLTSVDLERGRQAQPSAAFKARVRAKLTQEMQAHPRKSARFNFMFMQIASNLAVILLALLIAGTAYAQSTLPGNPFYAWKLTSESIWRVVSPDPVGTDLAIADRRTDELIAIGNNSAQLTQVLKTYFEVVARLKSEMDTNNEARIRLVLNSQIEALNESGILVPPLDQEVLPNLDEPTVTPTETPLVIPEIPQVNPTLPIPTATMVPSQETAQANPTDLPKIIPAIEVPTIEVPIIDVPSLIP